MLLWIAMSAVCSPASVSPPFTYNQDCPHVCWLGIDPGQSSVEEARSLLRSSHEIDQESYLEDAYGLRVEWHDQEKETNPVRVGMVFEKGGVKYINFLFPTSVQVQEFIDLLGQPDEISIRKVEAAEETYHEYVLYYPRSKTLLFVMTNDEKGPSAEDYVKIAYLNMDKDASDGPEWLLEHTSLRQPWLGFGRSDEYLKHELPSPAASPVPAPTATGPVWEIMENGASANQVRALLIDKAGSLWTGGPAGVVHWDLQTSTPTVYAIRDDPENTNVVALSQTPDGAIWAGTFGNGIARYDGRRWQSFTTETGLPGNYINDQAVTPGGELWLVVKEKEYDGSFCG